MKPPKTFWGTKQTWKTNLLAFSEKQLLVSILVPLPEWTIAGWLITSVRWPRQMATQMKMQTSPSTSCNYSKVPKWKRTVYLKLLRTAMRTDHDNKSTLVVYTNKTTSRSWLIISCRSRRRPAQTFWRSCHRQNRQPCSSRESTHRKTKFNAVRNWRMTSSNSWSKRNSWLVSTVQCRGLHLMHLIRLDFCRDRMVKTQASTLSWSAISAKLGQAATIHLKK